MKNNTATVCLFQQREGCHCCCIFARAGWRLPQLFYFHLSRTKDVTAVVSLLGQDEVCLSWCISTWAGESCHSWCIFTWVGWRLSTGSTSSCTDPPAATHLSMTDWNGFGMKLISKLANFSFLAMTRSTSLKKTDSIHFGKFWTVTTGTATEELLPGTVKMTISPALLCFAQIFWRPRRTTFTSMLQLIKNGENPALMRLSHENFNCLIA